MTPDQRWTAIFDRIALFLTLLGFLLREGVPGSTTGSGFNLFIHLLFWVALTLWFAGRATVGGAEYRFTGFEFAFLAFAVAALISVLRASFKPAALDQAMAWLSSLFLFVLCVQLLGRRLLLSILLATLFTLSLYALIQYFLIFPALMPDAGSQGIEMARRIQTREPSATFIGPNQLACFLVLLLPLLAGTMIDAREFILRGVGLALGLVALGLTGSFGGWVALFCAMATFLGLYLTRERGRTLAVGAGVAAVVVAVALLLWSPLLSTVAGRSHSMHVRAVYWRATAPIIASAPMLGVGLDNWQEHYFQTKSDVQQEAKRTHNDYLQVLAEMGAVGLLAFAAILVLGLRKALVRKASPEPISTVTPRGLIFGLVALLVLLGCLQSADSIGTGIAIVLGAAWTGTWLVLRKAAPPTELTWTRIGAGAGLVGFMVHMVVDFQIYEYGVAAALVAVLALIAMLRGDSAVVKLPKAVCAAATGILLLISSSLLLWVAPRAMAADTELEEVRAAISSFEAGTSANPTLAISDAIRVAESAQKHNPFNPDAYQLFARAKFHEWSLLIKAGARESRTLEETEGTVLQALDNALALRPRLSPLHYEKSMAHRSFRQYYLKSGKTSEMAAAKAAEHLRQAIEHQRRAFELYPTYCRNAYQLGRVLEMAKDPEAETYYREALRLGELAGKELENLDRLKRGPIPQARCLRAAGGPSDAHDVLDRYLRSLVAGLPADKARDRLERMVKLNEDELGEGMTPVLKDAVDVLLRELK